MRLEEYDLSLEIETGIRIAREDYDLLSPSGEWLPGVELTPERASILEEIRETSTAMVKAYTVMQVKGMDMNGRVLENEVSNILSGVMPVPENAGAETLVARYTRYVEEQNRDGVYSKSRYRELCSFVKKLERFLKIKGRSRMTLKEFTIQAISKGSDDVGKVHMQVEYDGSLYYGFGANTDIVTASVEAYIDCINKFKKED